MDKTKFEIKSIYDDNDYNYWKTKSYAERLSAVEQLRRIMFNYDPDTQRLQRILKVTKLKES